MSCILMMLRWMSEQAIQCFETYTATMIHVH